MATNLSTLASRMNLTTASTVATAIARGTVTAEVTALIKILQVMGARPDLAHPILKLADVGDLNHG